MPITIKPTQLKYKDPSTSQYVSIVAAAEGGSSNVDVQINGTSILNNRVANIPEANSETYGVLKTGYSTSGLQKDVSGYLKIYPATSDNIKAGTEAYRPIIPYHQHESVFYGLAKAAGADMSSSSNAVGIYTSDALSKIQTMLNVPSATNTVINGTFTIGTRYSNASVGQNSISFGSENAVPGNGGLAIGYSNYVSGNSAQAFGANCFTPAPGATSFGYYSIAEYSDGLTIGHFNYQTVTRGDWISGTIYYVGDTVLFNGNVIKCIEENSDTGQSPIASKWTPLESRIFVVGNGDALNTRSNALTLYNGGRLSIADYIYVGANADGNGGIRLPHDIQINGTSIVSAGVANIPKGDSYGNLGVVYADSDYGIQINNNGRLNISAASSSIIQAGTGQYKPLVPQNQHISVFYGLAKAAGDTTQSASSNAIGIYTDNAKASIKSMLGINVDDIQINGTSIVSNGVANIPLASSTTFGAVRVGDGLYMSTSEKKLHAAFADSNTIKTGTHTTCIIAPSKIHEAVFYGLAKVAGDATQSASSNAVGTYTDAAKTAIQNMLAVAPTSNPVFTDSLSMGRLENSTVGYNSVVLGYENSAISAGAVSIGYQSIAAQELAFAEGYGIVANSFPTHVFGRFNAYDGYDRDPWVAGTSYAADDVVVKDYKVYICQEANSDTEWDESKWYNGTRISLLQVGYGQDESYRKNVLNLDISGNLFLGGDVYVRSNLTCTSGNKVATVAQLPTVMTGATAYENGTSGLVPAPTPNDMYKFLSGDGTYRSGGLPMVILSYGNSTWNDFIEAYNNNVIVYCRASSNSNPASGSQTRMAFMAYVNDSASPTNVEFQYYRSMSSHSATAMGDEVYVYKLTNANGGTWSVTTRPASIKEIKAGTNEKIGVSWNDNKVILSNTMTADDMPMSSSDATTAKGAIDTINTKLGSIAMGTTATTITGAIAEHESDIGTLNSNVNEALHGISLIRDNVQYVYGTFNTTAVSSELSRFQDLISKIDTKNMNTCFDVICDGSGIYRITGYVYAGTKNYCAGFVYSWNGGNWSIYRNNGTWYSNKTN